MATRFGAPSPARTYAAKVRWLVSCLVAVIGVLVVTLFYIVSQSSEQVATPPPTAEALQPLDTGPGTVNILIASQRIEEGSQVGDHMISVQPFPGDRLPEGHFKEHEKHLVVNTWSTSLLSANSPLTRDSISQTRPINTIHIPAGYRAVTINVDARSGVEGWAKPNSRVDVLWTYTDRDKQMKVATIVRFSKVLSVGGNVSGTAGPLNGTTTVTLLVTERDAKKVELARELGKISLSLVGGTEDVKDDSPSEPVDISSILGTPRDIEGPAEEPVDGTMYSTDPKTGAKVRFVLRNGRWVRDTNF